MGVGGRKPKPAALKLVTGNPGKREVEQPVDPAAAPAPRMRAQPLVPPRKLSKAQRSKWDAFIEPAWWLTEFDVSKAYAWICLQMEFEKSPVTMVAARIAQLRALGSELGFDPASRARMPAADGASKDPADKYFR
jgi:hypothetical protein